MTDNTPLKTYTCVLHDAAHNILGTSSGDFSDEAAAMKQAAITVFLNESAAGYELWHRLRKVARFTKPAPGRA